jgi:glycosyltransferase involved in cell wall biosynthesis/predicted Zn-dependent protease
MIVRNEEARLGDCLASAAGLFDEIIVVDTGSTDRTREVTRQAGAKVFDFPWVDSFAAARNESLRHATGRWVMWLDADERLDEDNRARLRSLLAGLGGENVGYTMRQFSRLEAAAHAAAQVDQVRLFPNHPGLRWDYRVHEQILPGLRRLGAEVRSTDIVIAHAGFSDPATQGGKVERNLRLLRLEAQERPDDPFVLYNLGAVALTQGRAAEAVDTLKRCLALLNPGDSLEHKVYVLLIRGHQEMGRPEEALAACRAGRDFYPDDPELLFWEGALRQGQGDLAGAEGCFLRVLALPPPERHFTSVDAGLQGYRARHALAEIYRGQGRLAEAEAHWRAAVAESPDFHPAWLNLAELYLGQGRYAELEQAAGRLRGGPHGEVNASVLRARGHLACKEFAPAQVLLDAAIAAHPKALWPRVVLSHVLLQEGKDWGAAEKALRDVLAIDPAHGEARHNLQVLLAQLGRAPELNGTAQPTVVVAAAPANGRARVSLCLIVKDEEKNLPDCLGSAADLVDEIIVVDTGSADRTKEVAARFGARVFDFPWVDNFAAARNESLRHATGQWVFWLDADDRLDEDNRARLRALFATLGDDNTAYVMKCLCLPDPVTGTFTAVDHVRLFPNRPELRWSYRVHEQILPAVRRAGAEVRWTEVVIRHTGYQDPALRRRKLDRDLRLLRLEDSERPGDPFTLFNLGQVHQERGELAEAVACFRRSLAKSQPTDSIVRKLYALLAQCQRQLGQNEAALAACREGRVHYSEDVELLFQEALARRESGDPAGAEGCLRQLLKGGDGPHFASLDTGLAGYKARHNLGVLCQDQGRPAEAEQQWRAALAERPDFLPSRLSLADLYLGQGRWEEVEQAARGLEAAAPLEAVLLRARAHLGRREFGPARALLQDTASRFPQEVRPRVVLSHALLQEGKDWDAAESALQAVLALDPGHIESRRNLDLLRRQRAAGRAG